MATVARRDRWNIVAPPHDMTDCPRDVRSLSSVATLPAAQQQHAAQQGLHRLAAHWVQGHEDEESLWW